MENKMVSERSWDQFRNTGLIFLVNTLLHTFGWAIVFELDGREGVIRCYPARVKFRGFSEKVTSDAYEKISAYMAEESAFLLAETLENQ